MGVKGAIIGDIIGSQYEFNHMRPKDLDWKNVPLFSSKCKRTDDTILTLAAKSAILEGIKENKQPDFGKWYYNMGNTYNGGYGGMFFQWLHEKEPKPYNSFGNGSAMRVSFVGEYYNDPTDVIKMARESALPTHNHSQGIQGAIVTAMCEFIAKDTKNKKAVYDYALKFYRNEEMYKYPLQMSLAEMRKIYQWDVTCQSSVPAAIRCIYEADSYEEFIRNVMSLPCDMDTLGAIGGGIAEELFGLGDLDVKKILSEYLEPHLFKIALAKEL